MMLKISILKYFDQYFNCDVIGGIRGNNHFYIIILIFNEKHYNYYDMIFTRVCTKEIFFPRTVKYAVSARTSLQHDNI